MSDNPQIYVYEFKGDIVITIRCDCSHTGFPCQNHFYYKTISAPSWLEKLFKITWDAKVSKEKLKAQNFLNYRMKKQMYAEAIALSNRGHK